MAGHTLRGHLLTFSDYSECCRMAALMRKRVINVTHASIHARRRRRQDQTVEQARQTAPDNPNTALGLAYPLAF